MDNTKQLILISAGGTGGHMSPAAALAHDLVERDCRVALITDDRGKKFVPMFPEQTQVYVVKAGTLGSGITGKIKGVIKLVSGVLHARKIIKEISPSLVIGFGGYPSFPGVYAAQRAKIPTIIHEQNAILGWANRMLAPKAERIALSFPEIKGSIDKLERMRTVITGNPVRPDIAELRDKPYPEPEESGELRILIMGGSLGATVLSKVVPETLALLESDYKKRLRIVQQCRESDIDDAEKIYKDASINASLSTFIDDVAGELEKAHLVISRSGASTVSEVTAAGRPAIFVPYPHHKDQQQKVNADSVADGGGAWVMTENGFTNEALLARIITFLQNPETLTRAAENARTFGKANAAKRLGNLVKAIAAVPYEERRV